MRSRLFRNRNFMALWVGQIISFIGDYFVLLTVPIVINRLTGSTMMVGLSYIAGAIPALVLGPVAGVFIDRWDRRKVMIAADLIRALLVLINLNVHGKDQVWILFLTSFLMACTTQFFMPARSAVLPLVVNNEDDLLEANGLMQIIGTAGFLIGPALAGFAIGLWGEAAAFIANSAGYLASACAILLMSVPHTAPARSPGSGAVRAVYHELREGLVTLFTNSNTLGVVVMLTVAQLGIGAFIVIWIPFLQRFFHQGAQGVGLIDSFFGGGMVLGGLLLGALARRVKKAPLAAFSMILMGLIAAPISYAPTFGMILALNVLFGIALVPNQSALTTILQLEIPDQKRGRVSASLNASVTAGGLVSMALTSFFSDLIGLRNLFIVVGVLIMFAGLLGLRLLHEPTREVFETPARVGDGDPAL